MAVTIPASETTVQQLLEYLDAHRYAASTKERYRGTARRFLLFLARRRSDITTAHRSQLDSFLAADHRCFRRRYGRDPQTGGWRRHRTAPIHLLFRLAQ